MTTWRIHYTITLPEGTLSQTYDHTFYIRPHDWYHAFMLIGGWLMNEYRVRKTAVRIPLMERIG